MTISCLNIKKWGRNVNEKKFDFVSIAVYSDVRIHNSEFVMDLIFRIIFALMGAFLSVVLTKLFIQNGKAIQNLTHLVDEGFRKMDERATKIAELVSVEAEKTREAVKGVNVKRRKR
jgi:hypothetical protein